MHATSSRPNLLFLAPAVPKAAGNGLAMRCGVFLRALATDFRVHLHIVPLADPEPNLHAWPELHRLAADVVLHPRPRLLRDVARLRSLPDPIVSAALLAAYPKPRLARFETDATIALIQQRCNGVAFDAIHVSRLYLAPLLSRVRAREATNLRRALDLDDYESATRLRFSERRAANGETHLAAIERLEARHYEKMEDAWLPRFDSVYLANKADQLDLAARFNSAERFLHVPNAIAACPYTPDTTPSSGPVELLFVGTLNYFPNEDALQFFCGEVLPLIRRRAAPRAIRLIVAGAGPSSRVRDLSNTPGVVLKPDVADLAPLYRQATVVVAPVRVGGGSRIKVLEAFAHGRPTVATGAAVDGIDARDEVHLLIRDTAESFAAACLRLIDEPETASSLGARAFGLAQRVYADDVVVAAIRSVALQSFSRPGGVR